MTPKTKTKTKPAPDVAPTVRTRAVLDHTGGTTYASVQDQPGDRSHSLTLDRQVWEDLGKPKRVTVQVVAGDELTLDKLDDEQLGDLMARTMEDVSEVRRAAIRRASLA